MGLRSRQGKFNIPIALAFSSAGEGLEHEEGPVQMAVRLLKTLMVAGAVAFVAPAASALADSPAGFYYGADSFKPTATGSSVPYKEPTVGGTFGGYAAEVWTFADQAGCSTSRAVNTTDVGDANANTQQSGPTGTALFYFMGGPGSDPQYNASHPSASEAYNWGYNQAYYAYKYYVAHGPTAYQPIMFMDIENPGNGTFQGWDEETDKCGSRTGTTPIPSSIDRQTFNGFYNEIFANTPFYPGVYARQDYWNATFGTGSNGSLPSTKEWTSQSHNVIAIPGPSRWCTIGACAQWFGGAPSSNEIEWQWAIALSGDYDQIDSSNAF